MGNGPTLSDYCFFLLSEKLAPEGFRAVKSRGCLEMPVRRGVVFSMHVPLGMRYGGCVIAPDIFVGFSEVEKSLADFLALPKGMRGRSVCTVSATLAELVADRKTAWDVDNERQAERMAEEVGARFLEFGLPFLKRYSHYANAARWLVDGEGAHWVFRGTSLIDKHLCRALYLMKRLIDASEGDVGRLWNAVSRLPEIQARMVHQYSEWLER